MRPLLVLLTAALVAAGTAVAATPDQGSVSASSPTVSWSGTVTESYTSYLPMAQTGDDSVACQQPGCDVFTLKVADAGELTIGAAPQWDPTVPSSPAGGTKNVIIRVHKPDGTVTVAQGAADKTKPLSVKVKGAKPGDYVVDYADNHVGPPGDYTGTATLKVASAVAPAASPAPAAAPPAAAPKQDLTLTVKPRARAGRVTVAVRVSRPVTSIVAKLARGAKAVATARAGATASSAKLVLKGKRIRKGTYRLTVTSDDGAGVSTTRTLAVRVR